MVLISLLFIFLGILVKYGKMYFLIAGYNTMSEKEKSRYNIKKLGNLFGNVMFAMAGIVLLGYFLSIWLNDPSFEYISVPIAVIVGVPYLIIKGNSSSYKMQQKK